MKPPLQVHCAHRRFHTAPEVTGFNFGVGIMGPPMLKAWCYRVDDLLIDTGISRAGAKALEMLTPHPPRRILLTHHHEDHSGNAAALSRTLEIPVYGHDYTAAKLAKGFSICPYQHIFWGASAPVPVLPFDPIIESEHLRLLPIHTPGHSKDHTVFLEADKGWLFSGDLFLGEKIKFFRADENAHQQIQSLKTILNHDFEILFCAHRPTLTDGKAHLSRKLNYLEDLVGSVQALHASGMSEKTMTKTLGKNRDRLVRWITLNNASFGHLIASILHDTAEG